MDTPVKLTILNGMAAQDFEEALDCHLEWGLQVLDLKDGIYGQTVEKLSPEDAEQAAGSIQKRGMVVNTLSTGIFYADMEMGEAAFRDRFSHDLTRILDTAATLNPHYVRLLSASSSKRDQFENCATYIHQNHPWLFSVYQDAVDRIHDAGFHVVIENEIRKSIFGHPQEILDFFEALQRPAVRLTWDIANLWEEGTYPSLEVYEKLKPLIGLVHVKGGRAETAGGLVRWASRLEDASWPVLDIVQAVVRDRVTSVICVNPSHGEKSADYQGSPDDCYRDLLFLRKHIEGIV